MTQASTSQMAGGCVRRTQRRSPAERSYFLLIGAFIALFPTQASELGRSSRLTNFFWVPCENDPELDFVSSSQKKLFLGQKMEVKMPDPLHRSWLAQCNTACRSSWPAITVKDVHTHMALEFAPAGCQYAFLLCLQFCPECPGRLPTCQQQPWKVNTCLKSWPRQLRRCWKRLEIGKQRPCS